MSEHPNAARVRALFDAFRLSDIDAIREAIAEDAVCLARVVELTEGTFHLELEDVLANDDHAVALFRGSGTRGEKRLDNPTCLKIRLENGRAVEIREFVWDLYAVDEFWS